MILLSRLPARPGAGERLPPASGSLACRVCRLLATGFAEPGMTTGERNLASVLGLILIGLAIFVAISLVSYNPADAGHQGSAPAFAYNYGGTIGAYAALYLFLLVGGAAFVLPLSLLGEGIGRFFGGRWSLPGFRFLCHLALILGASSLLAVWRPLPSSVLGWQLEDLGLGGVWGGLSSGCLLKYLGPVGSRLVLVTVLAVSFGFLTAMRPYLFLVRLAAGFGGFIVSLFPPRRRVLVTSSSRRARPEEAPVAGKESGREIRDREKAARQLLARREEDEKVRRREEEESRLRRKAEDKERLRRAGEEERLRRREIREEEHRRREELARPQKAGKKREPRPVSVPELAARPSSPSGIASAPVSPGEYRLPPVDLLRPPPPLSEREIKDDIEVNSGILESTLADFGITATVVGAERGPAVTRYELQPAPGVKVQKIKALSNDIALTMKAVSVRILAPIPGKAAVGIEIPNSATTLVYLREMVESEEFQSGSRPVPVALGKDISGSCIVADITDMPHLLIAGTTGSGKTVCINSLLMSLLFSRSPDDLKLILVDPKKVEMTNFHSLPHLLCPVVTDPAKSAQVLGWLVREMETRYELFARAGVRNIESYNRRPPVPARNGGGEGEELPRSIPYILLIIDELADLMLTAPAEIENAIARLAHLSRSVGIHMVLATQRPSVDVITGVIKANFPARISFKVASKIDSRIVLDAPGADKLLGNGDLLFLPPASDRLIRAQGTMCSDEEIRAVVEFVSSQRPPSYDRDIFSKTPTASGTGDAAGSDPLLEAAIEVIKRTEQASVSILQRKLKIGYSRAARVMDILEARGIVGSYQGVKPREILIETYGGQAEGDGPQED